MGTPHINMDRVARYVSHLAPEAAAASADDDIVIVSAIRTAICRARKGGFRDTREQQDQLAADSHNKAEAAQANGWFKEEIIPVHTIQIDKEDNEVEVTITEDDGIRKGMKVEALAKLKPAFAEDGCTTAGNSSQTSDGAAAVLLTTRSAAVAAGLPIIGKFVSYACVGCPPNLMGIGPAVAIPAALKKAGMSIGDIDIFEVNEAFASQAVYCVDSLKIPREKCNPKGGAIAL